MNDIFKKDLYRCYGKSKESLKQRVLRPPEISYVYYMRKLQSARNVISEKYYRFRFMRVSRKTQLQIPAETKIGEGFRILHCGRIIVNGGSKLGKNINISTGVVIGKENRGKRKGCPEIKDNCWIGANSVIVGNITIGEDVLIAPLSFVNFDVPAHSIVIGNPGRIIPKEQATVGYIENTV